MSKSNWSSIVIGNPRAPSSKEKENAASDVRGKREREVVRSMKALESNVAGLWLLENSASRVARLQSTHHSNVKQVAEVDEVTKVTMPADKPQLPVTIKLRGPYR